MEAVLTAGQWVLAGLMLSLWLASMGAAWKVASILQKIADRLDHLEERQNQQDTRYPATAVWGRRTPSR
jgi:hypothetical protein